MLLEVCTGHHKSDTWTVAAAGEEAGWCRFIEVVCQQAFACCITLGCRVLLLTCGP